MVKQLNGNWMKTAPLKVDVHVHTSHSDSRASVEQVIETAKRRGLDGVAITDHHTLRGAEEAMTKETRLIIVPGEEVNTNLGDILALGIREVIPYGLSAGEAIRRVHSQGGLAIIPHPTIPLLSNFKESDLRRLPIDGLEVFSAITPLAWHYARKNLRLARRLKLPIVAGSDSHHPQTIGDAYTLIYTKGINLSEILDAIKQGKTGIGCNSSKLFFKARMVKGVVTYLISKAHRP